MQSYRTLLTSNLSIELDPSMALAVAEVRSW
jgi:hypothetical protein